MFSPRTRKGIFVLLLLFLVYAILTTPNDAAVWVREGLTKLGNGLNNVGIFVDKLMKR
jgi:hypothetical protein